jgi:branched-chain amino acid transport system ATP-binding protein
MTEAFALELQGVSKRFAGLLAVRDVSMQVRPGERRAILGPNGAGKTTLFNIITGELLPTSGRVLLFGQDVTQSSPHLRARAGMTRTFQRNNLFFNLSALENVRLAVQVREHPMGSLWAPVSHYQALTGEAEAILEQVGLQDRRKTRVAELSYGEQRQLELAVALAGKPRLLLLDEPTAGMSPAETDRMEELLARLPRSTTLLIIEHDMEFVAALADSITVLHHGVVLADGTADAVRADPKVQAVYLGTAGEGMASA